MKQSVCCGGGHFDTYPLTLSTRGGCFTKNLCILYTWWLFGVVSLQYTCEHLVKSVLTVYLEVVLSLNRVLTLYPSGQSMTPNF